MKKLRLLIPAIVSATVVLGGCAVYPESDPYYDPPVVRVAPPPPQYEYIGNPPVIGHVWIGGYWSWVGTRYLWVPGRWEAPRPGYYWAPHRWERHGDYWRPYGGRWERGAPPRVVVPAPPPRYEHRGHAYPPGRFERREAPPPAMRPEAPSRGESRPPSPPSQIAPPPQVAPPPPPMRPGFEQRESRRPMEVDPRQPMESRRGEQPRMERDDRDDRRGRGRERDRDGDGHPDAREGPRQ